MPAKIFSASLFGFDCRLVEVEADILSGISSMNIVGLGDTSVQESKERIRSAIKNSGFEYPRRKKTINLAPADLKKHGPLFDLPIALGLLVKSGQLDGALLEKTLAVGELSLDGKLRKVSGVIAIADFAKRTGFERVIVPRANRAEAAIIGGIKVLCPETLAQLVEWLTKKNEPQETAVTPEHAAKDFMWRFEDVGGQQYAKRALLIAAAGRHNVLLFGPPGSGKTMLARAFQSILPSLTFEEAIDTTKLHSIAGKLPKDISLLTTPPFRAIHHTASTISLIGGGAIPRPGEISLAHNGVLFLDELLEFPKNALDCLRQPLEDGTVNVTRVAGSASFPSRFILLAATNPCPCGYRGDAQKSCRCTPSQRQLYQRKLSGPLFDRMDLSVYVPRANNKDLRVATAEETSEQLLKRVHQARDRQRRRGAGTNGELSAAAVRLLCKLSAKAQDLLAEAFAKLQYSGRGYYRIIKVAQTIADLEAAAEIETHHVAEALQYRGAEFLDEEN